MKKFLKYISYAFFGLTALACSNEWEAPNDMPNHHLLFSSEMDFDNKIQVGGSIMIGDVSTGVTARTWTLPESGLTVLEGGEGNVATADVIKLQGDVAGDYQVKLSQTFAGNVYVGTEQIGTSFDTTLLVRVVDSIALSVTAQMVNVDGSLGEFLNMKNGALNEITAGSTVRYYYEAEGEPTDLAYTIEGANPSSVVYNVNDILEGKALETDVKYTQMGEHSVTLVGSRERPSGTDTFFIENLVSVIPSTEPVTLDAVEEMDDQVMLVFSREIDPLSLSTANFMVKIVNDGVELTPAVSKVGVKSDQGNVVLLTLGDEKLYNSDEVTVTYTPGSMKSTDGVSVDAFEQQVAWVYTNILPSEAAGFENGAAGWGFWANSAGSGASTKVVHSGEYSMNLNSLETEIAEEFTQLVYNVATPIKEEVLYRVSFWVYVEESTPNVNQGFADLRLLMPNSAWTNAAAITDPSNEEMYPKNTWVKFTGTAVGGGGNVVWMRPIGGNKLYIDDLEIAEYELRP